LEVHPVNWWRVELLLSQVESPNVFAVSQSSVNADGIEDMDE
jgi:hypothetical protein